MRHHLPRFAQADAVEGSERVRYRDLAGGLAAVEDPNPAEERTVGSQRPVRSGWPACDRLLGEVWSLENVSTLDVLFECMAASDTIS